MNHLNYKGYTGTIEYSKEDKLLFGKVVGIQSLLSYEGHTGEDLEANFRITIDEYLENCKNLNLNPEKPFKGSFNVRISPELHKELATTALQMQMSLNNLVGKSIQFYLNHLHTKKKKVML